MVNATVTFHGEDQKSYVVKTDADGRYIAMTDSQTQGLPPGKYAVTVHEALGDDIDARPVPNIHPKYTYSDSTDLSLVVADQPLETDFTLAPPKR